jgi:hypothetical protein
VWCGAGLSDALPHPLAQPWWAESDLMLHIPWPNPIPIRTAAIKKNYIQRFAKWLIGSQAHDVIVMQWFVVGLAGNGCCPAAHGEGKL